MNNDVKLDGAAKTDREVISAHYREIAKRSHAKVVARYGKDFYGKISRDYWAKKKENKTVDVKLA